VILTAMSPEWRDKFDETVRAWEKFNHEPIRSEAYQVLYWYFRYYSREGNRELRIEGSDGV
jgi:hypothetical protein